MTAVFSAESIAELDKTVEPGASARRDQILRRMTDLLVANAERLNASQIGIFGGAEVGVKFIANKKQKGRPVVRQ